MAPAFRQATQTHGPLVHPGRRMRRRRRRRRNKRGMMMMRRRRMHCGK
jgi:hypothetical protein